MYITLDTSLAGIQRGQQIVRDAAGNIARSATDAQSTGLSESLVDLKRGQLQVQASTQALGAELKLIGSLLDIFA